MDLSGIGIDLLINPKKRTGGGGSDADSIVSSVSGSASARSGRGYGSHAPAPAHMSAAPSGPPMAAFANFGSPAPQQPPPQVMQPPRVFGASANASADVTDEDDEGSEDDDDDCSSSDKSYEASQRSGSIARPNYVDDPARREREELREKREILYQLDRMQKKGVRIPQAFTMSSPLEDMRAELSRLKTDREVDASVRFQRRMLMACVTGIEFMNNKFDPFDVKLEGWSDSINENIDDYDDVFEELYMKYRGKAKMAPELKLLFMVGGSAVMFHLTNSMLKNMMPGMDQVLKQNPELVGQFTRATMNTMMNNNGGDKHQQQAATANRGGGGGGGGGLGMLGSLFGSLFGGGGGGAGGGGQQPMSFKHPSSSAPMPPGTPVRPPSPSAGTARHMRGPVAVDDILNELQQNAFSDARSGNLKATGGGNRIEVVSNASDSDISELLQDVTVMGKRSGKRQ